MLALLLLVALSLGLDNLGAAIGIGTGGADARTRLRVAVIFGLFEMATPVAGLLLGHELAGTLGHAARFAGAGLLIATGAYTTLTAARELRGRGGAAETGPGSLQLGRLLVTGAALSVDNLAVGFGLGTYHVSLPVAVAVIGAVSIAMSLVGLEAGQWIGARTGDRGELLGGIILIGVGAALAAGVL